MCSDNVLLCSQYRPRSGDVGQSDGRSSSNEAGETAKILFTSTVFNFSGAKIENNTIFLHIPLKITHKHFNYRESTQNCGTDLQSGGAKIPDILSS